MQTKSVIRKEVNQRLARLSRGQKFSASQRITETLQEYIVHMPVKTIGCYIPLEDEPDMFPLLQRCKQQDIKVVIPSRDDQVKGFIPRNSEDFFPCIPPIDILIVPGRAFTHTGIRVGRGGGWYDRVLPILKEMNPSLMIVGVCFIDQMYDLLPHEPHDFPVDIVLYA